MCHPELKLPSVEICAIRSRTRFVSATGVVTVAAIAIPAPMTPPSTNTKSTTHFFLRSACTSPPLPFYRTDPPIWIIDLQLAQVLARQRRPAISQPTQMAEGALYRFEFGHVL